MPCAVGRGIAGDLVAQVLVFYVGELRNDFLVVLKITCELACVLLYKLYCDVLDLSGAYVSHKAPESSIRFLRLLLKSHHNLQAASKITYV